MVILSRFMSRPKVAAVFEVGETTVWRILHPEVGSGDALDAAGTAASQMAPAAIATPALDDLVGIGEAALELAVAAQARGSPVEAQAHVKAGLAVADLAEAMMQMRAARGM